MLGLLLAGALVFALLRKPIGPPPAEIANDALLKQGYEVYHSRCVSCHGAAGKGNGPIAPGLGASPPPGDLTRATWKHGDRSEEVWNVVAQGVKGTAMPGWRGVLDPGELRAVTAYVYYLAGRPVPDELRAP